MSKLAFLVIIFWSVQLIAQNDIEYNNLVNNSNRLAFNFQFDSTIVLINKAKKLYPERPEAYQVLSKIYLWHFLGSKNKSDYNNFFNYSDSTIRRLEKISDDREEDKNLLYMFGNIYKYRAMAYGGNENSLDAFWATKNAVSYYEDAIDLDDDFYEAYGNIGVFEYALSFVPSFFNWALTLSGLSANKENGFNFIERAVQNGKLDKWEFQFHLAKLNDEHLAEYENSIKILNLLLIEFPDNILFRYQIAIEYIKNRQLDNAVKELKYILNVNHPNFIQTNSFSNFLLGDIHFRQKKYKMALNYYDEFLKSTKTIDYSGIAYLRIAYCHYFINDLKSYRKNILLAANGNLDLEDDKYAYDNSMVLLENGFAKDREIQILIENNYLEGNDLTNLVFINKSIDLVKDAVVKSEILYYKSLILVNLGELREAKENIKIAFENNEESPNWVLPMLFFNKAKISYLENNLDESKKLLEESEDSNEFEKQNLIQSYINGLRKRIESKEISMVRQ